MILNRAEKYKDVVPARLDNTYVLHKVCKHAHHYFDRENHYGVTLLHHDTPKCLAGPFICDNHDFDLRKVLAGSCFYTQGYISL